MKRKFNFRKKLAIFLTLVLLLGMAVQDVGNAILAAENPIQTDFEEEKMAQEEPKTDEGDRTSIWKVGDLSCTSICDAYQAATETESIKLLQDVTLTETLVVSKKITIDLNGHVLNRGATSGNNNVITIGTGGDLTIEDSAPKTVHYGSVTDEGIWVWDGTDAGGTTGDRKITGGIITGGYAETTGGGIVINGGGKLTMNGGTLSGNYSAAFSGGGLRVDLGSANLTNVNVCYNIAANGGGVYSTDVLNVEGGSISNNTATSDGGGVGVWGGNATLKNVTIKNNFASDAARAAIYVMNDNSKLKIRGELTKIDGAVTASSNINERIHLSNKLRWNGNRIEAALQDLAQSTSSIVIGGIAISGAIASDMITSGAIVGHEIVAKGSKTIGQIWDGNIKVKDAVATFARRNIWFTKQMVCTLQKAVLSAAKPLSLLLSRLSRLMPELPRLPSQLLKMSADLPRLPSRLVMKLQRRKL